MLSFTLSSLLASAALFFTAALAVDIPFIASDSAIFITPTTTAGPKFSGIQGDEKATIPFFPGHITSFTTSVVTAAPKFSGIRNDDVPVWDTASGGALDSARTMDPEVRATVTPLPGNGMFTVIFKNNAGEALTTMHTKNEGAEFPPLNGGMPAPGEFPAGAVKSAVLPTGYAGRIAFAQKGKVIDGWESLIEYSLITDKGLGFAPGDIDVSYVDGFTYPIVCNCKGVRLSGCPVNLWKGGAQCPELSTQGACKNPHRMKKDITYADPWFKRCEHQAYTYSTDDAANSNGQCQSGTVECIISPK